MTRLELVERVWTARRSIITETGRDEGWKVFVSPEDWVELKAEKSHHHGSLYWYGSNPRVFGWPLEHDRSIKIGDVVLRKEVAA